MRKPRNATRLVIGSVGGLSLSHTGCSPRFVGAVSLPSILAMRLVDPLSDTPAIERQTVAGIWPVDFDLEEKSGVDRGGAQLRGIAELFECPNSGVFS
jgi:hypothetical protein